MNHGQIDRSDLTQISDLNEFTLSLQRLRVWTGNPSLRTLAKKVGPLLHPPRVLSHTTLAHLFQPNRRRLDLDLVLAVVRALGLDESEIEQWHAAWFRVHATVESENSARTPDQLPADLAASGRTASIHRG